MRSHVSGFVAFSKVSTLESVFKSFHSGERFQKFPLWRAFSKVCGYGVRFRRIRVDDKRNRNKMSADTNESGYVWTGPKRGFELAYKQAFVNH